MTNEGVAVVLDISMVEKWEGEAVAQGLRLLRFMPCRGRKVKSILRTIRKERTGKRMTVIPEGRRGRLSALQSRGVVRHDGGGMFEFPRRLMRREFY